MNLRAFILFLFQTHDIGRGTSRKFSWKPVAMFTLANALPLGAVVYYLKESIETREEELKRIQDLMSIAPSDAVSRIESICRSSTSTLLAKGYVFAPIQPHFPESAPLILSTDELVANVDATIPGTAALFDSITASRDQTKSKPLSFIHFGIPSDSAIGKRLLEGKDRSASVVYAGGVAGNDVSVIVQGTATFVEDDRLRKFYWRDRWNSWINRDKFVLIKLLPTEVHVKSLGSGNELVDGVKFISEGDQWKRV